MYNEHSDGTTPSLNELGTKPDDNGFRPAAGSGRQEETSKEIETGLEEVLSMEDRRRLLRESSIFPEVVKARGYRTTTTKAELGRLGFSGAQQNVPALLIPVYSPRGEIANYQLRPDEPRIDEDGKLVKYETPRGSRMVLDVHPFVREKLGDPSIPLFITEGIKKGDALVSVGCAR